MRKHNQPSRPPRRAFTLIELLVVAVILSMLAGLLAPRVFKGLGKSKVHIARTKITKIENALQQFYLDCGRFPDASQGGLQALISAPSDLAESWDGPYCTTGDINDPWGRPYLYSPEQDDSGLPYVIISYGKDNQPGGSGENQDISNRDQ